MPIVREFLPLGRLSRLGFWWRHLLVLPLLVALCIAAARTPGPPWDLLAAAATTLFLVSVWGRRLHDRDRSVWWLLLASVPVLGAMWLLIDCALLGSRRERRAIDYRTV